MIPLAWAILSSGCMTVYEPLTGLHRPVMIDARKANFNDVRLDVVCPQGDHLSADEAAALCRKVGLAFENQGALVRTTSNGGTGVDDAAWEPADASSPRSVTLEMELRTQENRKTRNPLSWLICYGTFTLIPATTETAFAMEVILRDESGFLLGSDTLRGRFVNRFGLGAWGGNAILDVVWREPEEKLTGNVAERDFSDDLYRQLSQDVFNASMRASVLREAPPPGTGRPDARP